MALQDLPKQVGGLLFHFASIPRTMHVVFGAPIISRCAPQENEQVDPFSLPLVQVIFPNAGLAIVGHFSEKFKGYI